MSESFTWCPHCPCPYQGPWLECKVLALAQKDEMAPKKERDTCALVHYLRVNFPGLRVVVNNQNGAAFEVQAWQAVKDLKRGRFA